MEYRSRGSPAGVVVEVFGIRILHLANLQCGRRLMTFMSGSGRSRKYVLCEKKGNPTGLYLCVIMEQKVENPPCHGGSWRANAFECVNFGGKCLALWRQMPLGVGANAFECVCRCLWL